MKAIIETPTKAHIEFSDTEEQAAIQKLTTYKNKSVSYQIRLHKKKRWWEDKDPEGFAAHLRDLQSKEYKTLLSGNSIQPGMLPFLQEKYDISVQNNINYPDFSPIPWKKLPDFDPYDYQDLSVSGLIAARHGNIALPTGCGKSFILLKIAREMGLKTVVVTPSRSIFNELLEEFTERLGKKYVGGYGDGKKDTKKLITIAIGKSLTMLKPDSEAKDFFADKQLMLVDESHTFAAKELNTVCHGVLANVPYRMFVSATQTRTDGTEKLLYSIIGKNVYTKDLQSAITEGYLCPLKFHIINTFSPSTRNIADAIKNKREHFLYNPNIADYAANIANASWQAKQESTLILVEELEQIKMLTKRLKVPFAYAHSASRKNASAFGLDVVKPRESVDAFNKGEVKVLIGTSCISTGTNIYPTHNTVNWCGGSSEIATKQGAMGRSTRLLEKSKFAHLHKSKPHTKIWDFSISKQKMLNNQLDKRIGFYEETGETINYCG